MPIEQAVLMLVLTGRKSIIEDALRDGFYMAVDLRCPVICCTPDAAATFFETDSDVTREVKVVIGVLMESMADISPYFSLIPKGVRKIVALCPEAHVNHEELAGLGHDDVIGLEFFNQDRFLTDIKAAINGAVLDAAEVETDIVS